VLVPDGGLATVVVEIGSVGKVLAGRGAGGCGRGRCRSMGQLGGFNFVEGRDEGFEPGYEKQYLIYCRTIFYFIFLGGGGVYSGVYYFGYLLAAVRIASVPGLYSRSRRSSGRRSNGGQCDPCDCGAKKWESSVAIPFSKHFTRRWSLSGFPASINHDHRLRYDEDVWNILTVSPLATSPAFPFTSHDSRPTRNVLLLYKVRSTSLIHKQT
jgi:hypothetical protein